MSIEVVVLPLHLAGKAVRGVIDDPEQGKLLLLGENPNVMIKETEAVTCFMEVGQLEEYRRGIAFRAVLAKEATEMAELVERQVMGDRVALAYLVLSYQRMAAILGLEPIKEYDSMKVTPQLPESVKSTWWEALSAREKREVLSRGRKCLNVPVWLPGQKSDVYAPDEQNIKARRGEHVVPIARSPEDWGNLLRTLQESEQNGKRWEVLVEREPDGPEDHRPPVQFWSSDGEFTLTISIASYVNP